MREDTYFLHLFKAKWIITAMHLAAGRTVVIASHQGMIEAKHMGNWTEVRFIQYKNLGLKADFIIIDDII